MSTVAVRVCWIEANNVRNTTKIANCVSLRLFVLGQMVNVTASTVVPVLTEVLWSNVVCAAVVSWCGVYVCSCCRVSHVLANTQFHRHRSRGWCRRAVSCWPRQTCTVCAMRVNAWICAPATDRYLECASSKSMNLRNPTTVNYVLCVSAFFLIFRSVVCVWLRSCVCVCVSVCSVCVVVSVLCVWLFMWCVCLCGVCGGLCCVCVHVLCSHSCQWKSFIG